MSESQEVKLARLEERMKNVEKQLTEVLLRLDDISTTLSADSNAFATKAELDTYKKSSLTRMIATNIATAVSTGFILFLVEFYLSNR